MKEKVVHTCDKCGSALSVTKIGKDKVLVILPNMQGIILCGPCYLKVKKGAK